MEAAKQCRAQADECIRLVQSAQSETEARLLKSISQSWVRVANLIDIDLLSQATRRGPVARPFNLIPIREFRRPGGSR
jgi:hypothetical protein